MNEYNFYYVTEKIQKDEYALGRGKFLKGNFKLYEQEGIPVGCEPPATAVMSIPACTGQLVSTRGMSAQRGGMSAQRGVFAQRVSQHALRQTPHRRQNS